MVLGGLGRWWVVKFDRRAILSSVCDLSGSGVLEIIKILIPIHTAAIKLFFFKKVSLRNFVSAKDFDTALKKF